MWSNSRELSDLRERVEKLESQMGYLFRSLGISSGEPPSRQASPRVIELLRNGEKIEAIKAFREETGAGLKDAKTFIESIEAKEPR